MLEKTTINTVNALENEDDTVAPRNSIPEDGYICAITSLFNVFNYNIGFV